MTKKTRPDVPGPFGNHGEMDIGTANIMNSIHMQHQRERWERDHAEREAFVQQHDAQQPRMVATGKDQRSRKQSSDSATKPQRNWFVRLILGLIQWTLTILILLFIAWVIIQAASR